jgi:YbbR domain-containing protein
MIQPLRRIGKIITSNFHLKLTSILLASLLWVALNGEPQSVLLFKVPLEYRNYPKGIEVMGDTVNIVDVRVTAPSGIVKRIDSGDIVAFIDLSDWSLGERTYPLSSHNVTAPYGVKIVRITPNQVKLNFQHIRNKTVEIRPKVVGEVLKGYKLATVNCSPAVVRISGPEERLRSISYLSTETVDVTGRTGQFQVKVHLSPDEPSLQLAEDPEITVDVSIVPKAGKQR